MFNIMVIEQAKHIFQGTDRVIFALEPGDRTRYELFILRDAGNIIFGKLNGQSGVIAVQSGDYVDSFTFGMIDNTHTRFILSDVFHLLTEWRGDLYFTWKDGRIVR